MKVWKEMINKEYGNIKEFGELEIKEIMLKLIKLAMEVQHEATRSACANEVFTHRNIILSVKQPSV